MANIKHSEFLPADISIDCKKLDVQCFLDKNGHNTDCFTCVSLNTRSLVNKFQDVEDFISDLNSKKLDVSLIAFQVIWSIPQNLSISLITIVLYISQGEIHQAHKCQLWWGCRSFFT